jgi:hypothetical protein
VDNPLPDLTNRSEVYPHAARLRRVATYTCKYESLTLSEDNARLVLPDKKLSYLWNSMDPLEPMGSLYY